MSILGYSSAYFLPQYWANTPLYGEKIIPLLDYILSTDYQYTDKLASAFYDIESKYKNTGDLPIDKIEAIIEESGYGYIRNLLAQDEDSLRLLVYILVMVHELKGSKKGLEAVLELLRTKEDALELRVAGNPVISPDRIVSDFTVKDYISYSNFTIGTDPFDLSFTIKTGNFGEPQCIASSPNCGFYLGLNEIGKLVLIIGQSVNGVRTWQKIDDKTTFISDKAPLSPSTDYTINLRFSGYDYSVEVVQGEKTDKYIIVDSSVGLNITGGSIALGVDVSSSEVQSPFAGSISLAPFSLIAKNIKITQWFETFPVELEDTFTIDVDLDVNLISEDFFIRFAKFVERYVYPTLRVFKVKMGLKAKITFLPWMRQKVNYVISNIGDAGYENFIVLKPNSTQERELYEVNVPILYAWAPEIDNPPLVYTKESYVTSNTILYNRDNTLYKGGEFKVEEKLSVGVVTYKITYNGEAVAHAPNHDIYRHVPFRTVVEQEQPNTED